MSADVSEEIEDLDQVGPTKIYFSDYFDIPPSVLEEYGAFDISLINDLPLFVDPFLLFNSSNPEYCALHDQIIEYVQFLRDKAARGSLNDGLLEAWFTFREIKQNWLGYSLMGNKGSGLGMDFARALNANLASVFTSFGNETITRSSHLEKLCIVADGVGRDNISDFVTNLIKGYLLEYTQTFAQKYLGPDQRRTIAVPKAYFNYSTETWETRSFDLPYIEGGYVILTPVDMLTKDEVWINKTDMYRDYSDIADSISDEQLRSQVNNYFMVVLGAIVERDEEAKQRAYGSRSRRRRRYSTGPTQRQRDEAAAATVREYPSFIDHYIKWKEDHGDEAEAQADQRVRSSERLYIAQVRQLATMLLRQTDFYNIEGSTATEAKQRVLFLKDVIEKKGGWRLFYVDGEPVRREADLHILFRLTWCNTPSDVNREVNNGRGPSDFEVSRGRFDKSLIEFKLAKNTSLAKNLKYQAEAYKEASDAQHAIKVIVYFTLEEREKTLAILKSLGMENNPDVILIDARSDNKQSASKIDQEAD